MRGRRRKQFGRPETAGEVLGVTLRLGIIGCGARSGENLEAWRRLADGPAVVALMDPSHDALARTARLAAERGAGEPRRFATLESFLGQAARSLDAVYIGTPHAYHCAQAAAAMRAGLDVLLEKPMAVTVEEAERLLRVKRETGRTVLVAYQGSLSPLFARVRALVAGGDIGELIAVQGAVWQDWAPQFEGNWKQRPELSGGGFVFDTGSHLTNAVCDLSGRAFRSVAARFDRRGLPVEVVGTVTGALAGGIPVTLAFCGESGPVCRSSLSFFFSRGVARLDVWGRALTIETGGGQEECRFEEEASTMLETFARVRAGALDNPSPPETSLHLVRLWQAMQRSAGLGGAVQPIASA